MKRYLSIALIAVLLPATTAPLTGCTSSQVVNEVNIVLTEATNVLVVADPGAAFVQPLQAAVAALKTAEAGWTAGGPVQDVINALNTIVAITAVIPLTAQYSPLIDVLVAGIEVVLANLPSSVSTVTTATAQIAPVANPHVGKVVIPHKFYRSHTSEFKAAWNATALAHPGLEGAVIQ